MAKRLKQKLSRVIPSLQLCRPKDPAKASAFSGETIPAIHRLSPVNTKFSDISFPSFTAPAPPSTPDRPLSRPRHVRRPKLSDRETSSEYKSKNYGRWHQGQTTATATAGKPHGMASEESETLLPSSTPRSYSGDYTSTEFFSGSWSSSTETTEPTPGSSFPVLRKDGKLGDSTAMAAVKRSEDPLEDFKRSMWEMVVEKEMFMAEDLEELLLCFLSLNSRKYHPVIVEAFSEIWHQLFFDDNHLSPATGRRASKF